MNLETLIKEVLELDEKPPHLLDVEEFYNKCRTSAPKLARALLKAIGTLKIIDESDSFYSTKQCDLAHEALAEIEKIAGE